MALAAARHGGAKLVLHVSPVGSDAARCTAAQPCRSFNRAFQLASPGAVVEVGAGTYGEQRIASSGKAGPRRVVFRAAPGAAVTTGEVRINGARHIEFDRMTMDDYYVAAGSNDIRFRNVNAHFFFIRSSSNISIVGGSIGPVTDATSATIGAAYQSSVYSRNILIDGVYFHDMTRASDPSSHPECLFVQEVRGLTLRNSRFHHCDVFDAYFNNLNSSMQWGNVLIQNNFFDRATDAAHPRVGGYYSVFFEWDDGEAPVANILVRNNSFAQGFHFDSGRWVNTHVVGNVSPFASYQCTSPIEWHFNIFDHTRCGRTDRRAALGFIDRSRFDLHLKRGAAAIGADRSASKPSADIDRQRRPLRAPLDAGADQRDPAGMTLGGSIGVVRIGMSRAEVMSFYGRPRSRTGTRLLTDSYRRYGGRLWVFYTGDRVVGMATTSPYYVTARGVGVDSSGANVREPGLRWISCIGAYHGYGAGVDAYVRTHGGRSDGKIERVSMMKRAYSSGDRCKRRPS